MKKKNKATKGIHKVKSGGEIHLQKNNFKASSSKKATLSAIIGNGLEFYDFALFGAFSVMFSKLFFSGDKISSLFGTLSIFAVAFFVRPLGSVFFGYLGDQFGRKKALGYSIILMGFFTFCIGCLPLYQDVGFWAPLLLLCCRLGQGFCLGGENNGSAIFLLEHTKKRKGFAGALILTGGAIGTIFATLFSAVVSLPAMPEWAWRAPFLLGILIALLGAYIRNSIDETPEFKQLKQKRSAPLFYVLKNYTRPFLCVMGIGGVNGVLAYTLVVYTNVYLSTVVKYPLANALFCSCVGLGIFGTLSPFVGHLADKFGARRVMGLGCFITMMGAPFLFYLLQQQTPLSIFMALFMAAVMMSSFNSPTNVLIQHLFPTEVRYTGVAFGYALGIALLGGTQPLICTYLIETTNDPFSPAFYLIFAACIGMISLLYSRKTEEDALGFSQTSPEYSRPSNRKSGGIPSLEKKVSLRT